MPRAIILVLDSFGLGAAPDAADFGDEGSDTLGHIADVCARGDADDRGRQGPLYVPNMTRLGLGQAAKLASGRVPLGLEYDGPYSGWYGACAEQSRGKDTPSGHWEIAGVPVDFDWGYFPPSFPSFPEDLLSALIERCDLAGVLGNQAASGTEIIDRLGLEHMKTHKPIFYTSADSILQIAAHEETFGLQRLYDLCETARKLVDDYNIGRVIARPFVGQPGSFKRTANRKDLATPPPDLTLLDHLKQSGRDVVSVGKISDIFAHQGVTQTIKADGNMALFDATLSAVKTLKDGGLVFSNFVDFDSAYGHRRDVSGYAAALEAFDARLPELSSILSADDLMILTADHGCDPTWFGSDHTREYIPFLALGPKLFGRNLGLRSTFADIGQTVARHLSCTQLKHGVGVGS